MSSVADAPAQEAAMPSEHANSSRTLGSYGQEAGLIVI
jgi:hypothetical protein